MDVKKANLIKQMIVFLMLVFLVTSSAGSAVIGSMDNDPNDPIVDQDQVSNDINNEGDKLTDSGSGDSWGYNWVNSTGSPSVPYQWHSWNESWTDLGLNSDDWGEVDLGFNFTFYGIEYDSAYVMSNGWLSFTDMAGYQHSDYDFPGNLGYNCVISPYSADLNLSSGNVSYHSSSDQLMVSWNNVNETGTANYQTFQVVLNKTGEIWFNYHTVNNPVGNVGIENQNSTIGIDYATNALESGHSIKFDYTLSNRRVVSNPKTVAGFGGQGETMWCNLTINNRGTKDDIYKISLNETFWNSTVFDSMNGEPIDNISVSSDSSEKVYIRLEVPDQPADRNSTVIDVESKNDPAVNDTSHLVGFTKAPILLVDSDAGLETEDCYYQALDENNYSYNYWDYSSYGTPSLETLDSHQMVIWFTGNKYSATDSIYGPSLDGSDRATIGEYISGGGSIYLSSAQGGLDANIKEFYVLNDMWGSWIKRYLQSEWVYDDSGSKDISGVPGDPISDGLNLSYLTGDSSGDMDPYHDTIKPVGDGVTIFNNISNSQKLGVRGKIGTSRVIYTGFDFSGINNGTEENRTILMDRIVKWLSGTPNKPINPAPKDGQKHVSQDPTLSVEVVDPQGHDLDVTFYNSTGSTPAKLGTIEDVASGNRASLQWNGLQPNTTYNWYVNVSDGFLSNKSIEWNFTTQLPPEVPFNQQPADDAEHVSVNPSLSVDVVDPENDSMLVTFYNASDDSNIGTADNIDNSTTNNNNGTAEIDWDGLSSNRSYEWYCIVEQDDGKASTRSPTWSFTTHRKPDPPYNPSPVDGKTDLNTSTPVTLQVEVSDPDGALNPDGDSLNITFYDASDDTEIDRVNEVTSGSTVSVDWSNLNPGTTYEWYAVVDDGELEETSEIWSFTTNYKPRRPSYPSPYHEEIGISLNPTLSVKVTDQDDDDMDVTFYDASDDNVIGSNTDVKSGNTTSVVWSDLSIGATYEWYAVAYDGEENRTSVTWNFTTSQPPNEPSNPKPIDGATGVSTTVDLEVLVSDEEGESMNVSFYDASDDSLIGFEDEVEDDDYASIEWAGLSPGETHGWYVIAEDSVGATESPVWSFNTTGGPSNSVPDEPSGPNPSDGSMDISTSPTLSVEVSDPDDDSMDVSFYDASDDSLIGTDTGVNSGSTATTSWTDLSVSTTYEWYAVADDGVETINSTTWSFTTRGPNTAPETPTTPSPSDGSTDISTSPTLSVEVSDPDDDSMDVSFYDASDDSLIGTDTGVNSGSTASTSWTGLSANTTYGWYAAADDGLDTSAHSSTWSFTTTTSTDQTPPSIDDSTPADGATDVDIKGDITITLDEEVDPDTVEVTLTRDGDEVTGAHSLSTDNKIITFTPDNDLDKGTEYEVTVKAQDTSGNEIDEGFSFTTTEGGTTDEDGDDQGLPIWAIGIVLIIIVLVIAYIMYNRTEGNDEEETDEDDAFHNTGSQETAADFFSDGSEEGEISEDEYESEHEEDLEEDLFEDTSEEPLDQENA